MFLSLRVAGSKASKVTVLQPCHHIRMRHLKGSIDDHYMLCVGFCDRDEDVPLTADPLVNLNTPQPTEGTIFKSFQS